MFVTTLSWYKKEVNLCFVCRLCNTKYLNNQYKDMPILLKKLIRTLTISKDCQRMHYFEQK